MLPIRVVQPRHQSRFKVAGVIAASTAIADIIGQGG